MDLIQSACNPEWLRFAREGFYSAAPQQAAVAAAVRVVPARPLESHHTVSP